MTDRGRTARGRVAWVGLVASLPLVACGEPQVMVVEIGARATVGPMSSMIIEVANGGSSKSEQYSLVGVTFPATFSVTTDGREGELAIRVRGLGDSGLEVGRGDTVVPVTAAQATLGIDPSDFVINSDFVGFQEINSDEETTGFQLAASDSAVTFGFEDDCPGAVCGLLGRRYNFEGQPQFTDLSIGVQQFAFNELTAAVSAEVALASDGAGNTIAVWDTGADIMCRPVYADGASNTGEVSVATGQPDVVSAHRLANNDFVVVWNDLATGVRATVLNRDCGVVRPPFQIATAVVSTQRPAAAVGAGGMIYTWIDGGIARYRRASSGGLPIGGVQGAALFTPATTSSDAVEAVRPVAIDGGFMLIHTVLLGTRYELRAQRLLSDDRLHGVPTRLGDVEFISAGAAGRSDGAVGVAWTDCLMGDGAGCGVRVRLLRPDGLPASAARFANTTTDGDQRTPSIAPTAEGFVVSFSDYSNTPPDVDSAAVRGRFLYPSYDGLDGIVGARCNPTAACRSGLVCAADASGTDRCHQACDLSEPDQCLDHGGLCTSSAGGDACLFPAVSFSLP